MHAILLAILVAAAAPAPAPPGPLPADMNELLSLAASETPPGRRARAVVVNAANTRTDEIIQALSAGDDTVRESAAWVLRHCADPKAVPALAKALRDEDFSVGRIAAASLKERKAADAPLAELLNDPDPRLRWRAAANIGYVSAAGAVPALARTAVGDGEAFVRVQAVTYLTVAPGPESADALIQCFLDADSRVRERAAGGFDAVWAWAGKNRNQAVQDRMIAGLLDVLEKHTDNAPGVKLATDKLAGIALARLGADPDKWRQVLGVPKGGEK